MDANKPKRQTINKYLPRNSRKSQQSWWTACGAGHSKFKWQVAKTCGRLRSSSACVFALIAVRTERARNVVTPQAGGLQRSWKKRNSGAEYGRVVRRQGKNRPTDGTDSVLTFTSRVVLEGDGDDWLWRKKIIGLAITARAKNGLRPLVGPANRRQRNDTTLRHRGAARPRGDHGRNQKRSDKHLPPPPPPPPVCGILLIIIIGTGHIVMRYPSYYEILLLFLLLLMSSLVVGLWPVIKTHSFTFDVKTINIFLNISQLPVARTCMYRYVTYLQQTCHTFAQLCIMSIYILLNSPITANVSHHWY